MRKDSDKDRYQILAYKIHLEKIGQTVQEFENHSIFPILIKGVAAAVNYPKPFQRVFSDIDLAVDPEEFEKAQRIIEKKKFNVDLHKGLRHLDTLDWCDLFKNSEIADIGGIKVRFLCPEDHLRVMCVHWLNDGGTDRTRLWDVYFAVKNRPEDFSWQRFFDVVDEKRKVWLKTVLSLTGYYLGMDLNILKLHNYSINIPDWVWYEVEREWGIDDRLIPLHQVLNSKNQLIKQIKRRLALNTLQAVVENEAFLIGESKNTLRILNGFKRVKPSLRRIIGNYMGK